MKDLLIVGNWKANKTVREAQEWLKELRGLRLDLSTETKVVVCAPFTALAVMKWEIESTGFPVALGAQDVSPFPLGAYTGAVAASQIKELANFVIIGHSERRKYFGETDVLLARKVIEAKDAGLSIIYCVPDEKSAVPDGVAVVAYEPVWAIGTGNAESPESACSVMTAIRKRTGVARCIYGGSVTPANVGAFVSQSAIDGVLPGGASLSARTFSELIVNAQKAA